MGPYRSKVMKEPETEEVTDYVQQYKEENRYGKVAERNFNYHPSGKISTGYQMERKSKSTTDHSPNTWQEYYYYYYYYY
jgi:hypothetical protein